MPKSNERDREDNLNTQKKLIDNSSMRKYFPNVLTRIKYTIILSIIDYSIIESRPSSRNI